MHCELSGEINFEKFSTISSHQKDNWTSSKNYKSQSTSASFPLATCAKGITHVILLNASIVQISDELIPERQSTVRVGPLSIRPVPPRRTSTETINQHICRVCVCCIVVGFHTRKDTKSIQLQTKVLRHSENKFDWWLTFKTLKFKAQIFYSANRDARHSWPVTSRTSHG